jgi:hypothetical protein
MRLAIVLTAGSLALLAPAALAQTNVDSTNKYAWTENTGWLNWRDAGSPVGAQGAKIGVRFLSGFVWGENIGWINLGDGTPANGTAYANVNGTDFGVNRDPATGNLSGYAWGENVGWINFGPFSGGSTAAPARANAGRLSGYAWGENIGWINLDVPDAGKFVGFTLKCNAADVASLGGTLVPDGALTADDIVAYLAAFFANNAAVADIATLGGSAGPDGSITADDLIYFLSQFFLPC